MSLTVTNHIKDLPIGTKAYIVGYDKVFGGYIGRLLSMGLTPGTTFTVVRHGMMGYPVQIEVRGCLLSLRKQEADALCVEELD